MNHKRTRKEEEDEGETSTMPGFMASASMNLGSGFDTYDSEDSSVNSPNAKVPNTGGVPFEDFTATYQATTNKCPLCLYGLFTFQNSKLEKRIGMLIKTTVFFVSREQTAEEIRNLLLKFRQQQLKDLNDGKLPKREKIIGEITTKQVMDHITYHMTEYSWELRTQIDEQRSIISNLKKHIMCTNPETGEEFVHFKNQQLLQVAYTNLRKMLQTDVAKGIAFKPELSYTKDKTAEKET